MQGIAGYVIRRLLLAPLILLFISAVTFSLGRWAPGDYVDIQAGPRATEEIKERIREERGLNDPVYEQLTVPRSDDPFWAANPSRNLSKFPPDGCVLLCPASPDPHDDRSAPTYVPRTYEIDKDRFYDDHYGLNVFGFDYIPSVRTISQPTGPNAIPTSYLYHRPNAAGQGGRTPMEPIRGRFVDTPTSTNIGTAKMADAAGTILLMDYIKADAQPFPGVDGLYGYRFRHRGKANVLFADGHVEGFRKARFLRLVGGPTLHWEVRRGR